MVESTIMKQTIDAFWGGVVQGDGRITEYDRIQALRAMSASLVEILDAIAEAKHASRGYTEAIASDLAVTLPDCGLEVAAQLQQYYGIHPASMVFRTSFEDLTDLFPASGLERLPVRWLNDGEWVKGLETLPGHPPHLVGVVTWPIGTFRFHGQPDARISLPGLDVDSGLDLRDCNLFGFSNRVGSVEVEGSSVTHGPTDLSDMQVLRSRHYTHILSDHGTEEELRLPRFAPECVEFVRAAQ